MPRQRRDKGETGQEKRENEREGELTSSAVLSQKVDGEKKSQRKAKDEEEGFVSPLDGGRARRS